MLKLPFRVGDLGLPERRKRYTSKSREEEDLDTHLCPCSTPRESRTHILGECEIFKEEQNVLAGVIRKFDECDMEKLCRLESS